MTRKSKREIERALDRLEEGDGAAGEASGITVAWRDPHTGDLCNEAGEPLVDEEIGDLVIVLNNKLAIPREQAEREGRKILGPAEDAEDNDVVLVPWREP